MIQKESILDITYKYVQLYYKDKASKETKLKAYKDFKYLLNQGWIIKEIKDVLNSYYKKHKLNDVPEIKKIFSGKKPKSINLINPNKYYYHNLLRITPPPPEVDIDMSDGELIKKKTEHYLEFIASLTIDELYNYYISKPIVESYKKHQNKDKGGLMWLVNQYGIDETLFMIDAAQNALMENEKKLYSPLKIQEYKHLAMENINKKRNEIILVYGKEKMTPKKRKKD
jgi:hypothetical protein